MKEETIREVAGHATLEVLKNPKVTAVLGTGVAGYSWFPQNPQEWALYAGLFLTVLSIGVQGVTLYVKIRDLIRNKKKGD